MHETMQLEDRTTGFRYFLGHCSSYVFRQRTESGIAAAGIGRAAVNGEEQAGIGGVFLE